MIKAHGDYILPENVPANEFLNLENDKISTSKNWAVWLHEYLEEFPEKEDVLRYTLCANMPETKDNDFTWKDFQAKNNNELVAILGNFINRAVVLTQKYFDGKIPERKELTDYDKEVLKSISESPEKISASLDIYRFREALANYIEIARIGNKYLADTEPWKEIKKNPERVGTILNVSLQIAAKLGIFGEPFLPFSAKKIRQILNIEDLSWDLGVNNDILKTGGEIEKPFLLFEKIEDDKIEFQINKLKATRESNESSEETVIPEVKDEIEYPDFAKLDMRIGTILSAEPVPKSKKLIKLQVDIGIEQRTVLSGIAEQFSPEDVIGKQVVFLANLKPRKMMGIESQGMILMSEDPGGVLQLLKPDNETDNGSVIS